MKSRGIAKLKLLNLPENTSCPLRFKQLIYKKRFWILSIGARFLSRDDGDSLVQVDTMNASNARDFEGETETWLQQLRN